MDDRWSIDRISNDAFRQKFIGVPDIIAEWAREHGRLEGRDVLARRSKAPSGRLIA